MALTNQQKQVFDTTFSAYLTEDNGDINAQPLKLSPAGNLITNIEGSVISSMTAINEYAGDVAVKADAEGALDLGGLRLATLQNGNAFSVTSLFNSNDELSANLPSVMNDFRATIQGAGYSRMYGYTQQITFDGSKYAVFLSAYGGNVTS